MLGKLYYICVLLYSSPALSSWLTSSHFCLYVGSPALTSMEIHKLVFSTGNTLSITSSVIISCIGHYQCLFILSFTSHNFNSVIHHALPHKNSWPTFTCQTLERWKNCKCPHYSIYIEIHECHIPLLLEIYLKLCFGLW